MNPFLRSTITKTEERLTSSRTGNPFGDAHVPQDYNRAVVEKLSNHISRLSMLTGVMCAALVMGTAYVLTFDSNQNTSLGVLNGAFGTLSSYFRAAKLSIWRLFGIKENKVDLAEPSASSTVDVTTSDKEEPVDARDAPDAKTASRPTTSGGDSVGNPFEGDDADANDGGTDNESEESESKSDGSSSHFTLLPKVMPLPKRTASASGNKVTSRSLIPITKKTAAYFKPRSVGEWGSRSLGHSGSKPESQSWSMTPLRPRRSME